MSFSKGILNPPSERLVLDPVNYKKSMEKLGKLDVETILTGHGNPVTTDANRLIEEFIVMLSVQKQGKYTRIHNSFRWPKNRLKMGDDSGRNILHDESNSSQHLIELLEIGAFSNR